jgi:hypothetical protein
MDPVQWDELDSELLKEKVLGRVIHLLCGLITS